VDVSPLFRCCTDDGDGFGAGRDDRYSCIIHVSASDTRRPTRKDSVGVESSQPCVFSYSIELFAIYFYSEFHYFNTSPRIKSNRIINRQCATLIDQHISTRTQSQHDGRFYELMIYCPDSYPASPPEVKFVSRISMTCVDSKTGKVNFRKVNSLPKQWNRNMGIEQVLVALRHEMQLPENRKLKQPSEGSVF